MSKKIIIALDGHAGSGKSSVAKAVAKALGYPYVDSGAFYRSVTLFLQKKNLLQATERDCQNVLKELPLKIKINPNHDGYNIYLNNELVNNKLHKPVISKAVSRISAFHSVREKVLSLQKSFPTEEGLVMDGRDIGTKVYPQAELKFFMTAHISERAKRRAKEFVEQGHATNQEELEHALTQRDFEDETRKFSPLIKAKDAILLDTTNLTFHEVVQEVLKAAKQKIKKCCIAK